MADPRLGPEEHLQVKAVADGGDGVDTVDVAAPVARYLERELLPRGGNVVFDSVAQGAMIAVQLPPEAMGQVISTADRRFKEAIAEPGSHDVAWFLMPDPARTRNAAIGRAYPRLWAGNQPGFRLVATLRTRLEQWRIYAVPRRGG
jgi:hypothetical protein